MLQIPHRKMDPVDPIQVYAFIRGILDIDPVAVYDNLVDLPLLLTGPEVTTVVIGVTPSQRLREVADFVAARMAIDEVFFNSPFLVSASVQMDPRRGTPRVFTFGHLDWTIRAIIPTPYPSELPQEICEMAVRIGPCLGVDLEAQVQRLNNLLLQCTGRSLAIDVAPPMDALLREIFPPPPPPRSRADRCRRG
jgi:hypothetical protein